MAALTLAARLALLATVASAAPELPALYGMAGIALPNGAIYAAELGPIDASGDAVAPVSYTHLTLPTKRIV